MFCGLPAKYIKRKRGQDVHPVLTMEFQEKVLEVCGLRNDEWGQTVKGRISSVNDLHAADALYHQACSVNFRTGKNVPVAYSPGPPKEKKTGRPNQADQDEAFLKTVSYLQSNDDEQITVADLTKKMAEYCDEPFSCAYMKQKLLKHFDKDILITEINGLPNVVTFCYTAKSILYDFYKNPHRSSDKESIIKTAARLILSDIKAMPCSKDVYPSTINTESLAFQSSFVPESLRLLLSNIFPSHTKNELKMAAIGQAIVQTTRPRSILAPLQVSLGIQLHQHFASRFLIDTLNSLGFSSSYPEIKLYQSCAAVEQANNKLEVKDNASLQFIADNVDHNSCTIDGNGTFHGMGIIAGLTPDTRTSRTIPRSEIPRESILELSSIDLMYYKKPQVIDERFHELRQINITDKFWHADFLCSIIWPIRTPRISWAGFMQMFRGGEHPGKSSTVFFPMIDLSPSDMSCVFTTLHFVCKEALKYEKTPIVTFDQPLYWKAHQIICSEPEGSALKRIVLRLGGFHLEMSFLGAIGHLMAGSGLQEALETVYAPNAVGHMVSGKAVSRAVRGHDLVVSGLNALLLAKTYEFDLDSLLEDEENCNEANTSGSVPLHQDDTNTSNDYSETEESDMSISVSNTQTSDLQHVCSLYDSLVAGEKSLKDVAKDRIFEEISSKIECKKAELEGKRTANLWFVYMQMVQLLKKFLEAERTGNWNMHLHTISLMLPYFAAAGHNLYLKSAYVYLSEMQELEHTHPDVYDMFKAGHHVLRRSNRFWAGLSSDIVIEQVLMRSMKTSGGLTRGRGMTEFQRIQWLLSSPACAEMNNAMQTLTGVNYQTSEQHKESGKARQTRDSKDATIILRHLIERDPFEGGNELRSIETGMTADEKVNVDKCKTIGMEIVTSMAGESVAGYTFKRSRQAVTLNSRATVKVDDDNIHVDPQLLFQRLTTISRVIYPDISVLFDYELAAYPSSLFESSGLPREAQKSSLATAIWSLGDFAANIDSGGEYVYVLDGGSLIHKIPWEQKASFGSIIDSYTNYVLKKFGHATIVFDGYPNHPTTKDITHIRRSKGICGRKVIISNVTTLNTKKEHFLANTDNKRQFISHLSLSLQQSGCEVLQARDDADTLIVETAINKSTTAHVAVIGEDTDLLVLLINRFDPNSENDILFYSERRTKDHKVWNIRKASSVLPREICRNLPLIHAITGCDTTSRVFGIGKTHAIKKFIQTPALNSSATMFLDVNASKANIASAGESIVCSLFAGMPSETLNQLRYRKFVTKTVSCTSFIQVHELPPTAAANHFHSLRTYHQVQMWTGNELNPLEYGWKEDGGKLLPIKTILPAAPDDLLKVVRCSCKRGCDSKRCTCRRHGVMCSIGCKECHGITCDNRDLGTDNLDDDHE